MDEYLSISEEELMREYPPGQGIESFVPPSIKETYNWGVWNYFFWCLGNNLYKKLFWLLVNLIPVIGWIIFLLYLIYAGGQANGWAWQNRVWQSVEQFNKIQRGWAILTWLLFIPLVTFFIVSCAVMATVAFIRLNIN